MGFEIIKVSAALLLTLAAVYLLLRFMKQKMLPQKGMIEMLHYQSLGPKRGIAIIKIVNDYIAVGIADESISLLSKLNREEIEELRKANDDGPKAYSEIQKSRLKWLGTKQGGDRQ